MITQPDIPPPDYLAAIGYLKRAHGIHEFADSVNSLFLADTWGPEAPHVFDLRICSKVGSYRVDRERNTIGEWLCGEHRAEPRVTKGLLLDDDHSFTPAQAMHLLSLVSEERPVVSGLYYAVHSHDPEHPFVRPVIFQHKRLADGSPDLENYETPYNYPRNTLLEDVDHIGLGFCGIWLPLLETWRKEHGPTWFDFDKRPSGKHTLEDEGFCRKVRHVMKKPICLHTGIVVKHWKAWGVDEEFFDNQTAGYEKRAGLLVPAPKEAGRLIG